MARPENPQSDMPRIFHARRAATLYIGSELRLCWCAILGLNQWHTATRSILLATHCEYSIRVYESNIL